MWANQVEKQCGQRIVRRGVSSQSEKNHINITHVKDTHTELNPQVEFFEFVQDVS